VRGSEPKLADVFRSSGWTVVENYTLDRPEPSRRSVRLSIAAAW
jgi:hypothetical protein